MANAMAMGMHAGVRTRSRLGTGWEAPALLLITVALLSFGFVSVYSASAVNAMNKGAPHYHFVLQQMIGAAGGLVGLAIMAQVDYRRLRMFAWPLLLLVIEMLVVVILPGTESISPRINGSRRFIMGSSLQPSEFAKLAVIVWTAMLVVKKGEGGLRRPVHRGDVHARALPALHHALGLELFGLEGLVFCLPGFLSPEWLSPVPSERRAQIALTGRLLELDFASRRHEIDNLPRASVRALPGVAEEPGDPLHRALQPRRQVRERAAAVAGQPAQVVDHVHERPGPPVQSDRDQHHPEALREGGQVLDEVQQCGLCPVQIFEDEDDWMRARLRRGQGPAAPEYGEPVEDDLFARAQQGVAPVDRRPQRLLAGLRRACTGREQGEAVHEPVGDLRGRHG